MTLCCLHVDLLLYIKKFSLPEVMVKSASKVKGHPCDTY